jgi:hypothetical protein
MGRLGRGDGGLKRFSGVSGREATIEIVGRSLSEMQRIVGIWEWMAMGREVNGAGGRKRKTKKEKSKTAP